ncbi:hypothetical protein [Microvirga sp. TS319]|uniref:ComEA family DNA-binding protein n=1 Tax=Microvirga sp. TS319 TaxID=3241165 RepID=UPI00351A763F
MQIGNLSRPSTRSRGIFAFQMARVFIVVTLAATGAYAFSMSVENRGPQTEAAASLGPQLETVSASLSTGQPDETAPVQVANPEPTLPQAAIDNASASTPAQEILPQPSASASLFTDQSISAPAASGLEPAPPQAVQASAPAPAVSDTDMTGAVTVASAPAEPEPTSDLVDLNAASFEELNSLRNAGPLGRAIIKGRPYASVEDLVTRKIVRRSVYEKIKDQVAVR